MRRPGGTASRAARKRVAGAPLGRCAGAQSRPSSANAVVDCRRRAASRRRAAFRPSQPEPRRRRRPASAGRRRGEAPWACATSCACRDRRQGSRPSCASGAPSRRVHACGAGRSAVWATSSVQRGYRVVSVTRKRRPSPGARVVGLTVSFDFFEMAGAQRRLARFLPIAEICGRHRGRASSSILAISDKSRKPRHRDTRRLTVGRAGRDHFEALESS